MEWAQRQLRITHQICSSSKCPDDDLRVDTLLYKRLALFKKLTGQQNNTSSSITNLAQYSEYMNVIKVWN